MIFDLVRRGRAVPFDWGPQRAPATTCADSGLPALADSLLLESGQPGVN